MAAETTPDFDLARAAAKPRERLALVQYIHGLSGVQETDYLEWKCGYDLSKRKDAAKTAKHLVGFANRTVAAASRHLDGHAYLALGVEPGVYADVEEWDSAKVQDWLEPFVEDELRYDIYYVLSEGHRVLLFDVEPPRAGDPIYTLQSASEDEDRRALPEGVYVRRPGKTEPAKAKDFAALQERLRAGVGSSGPMLALSLEVDDSDADVLSTEMLSDSYRDYYLAKFHEEAVAPLPESGYRHSSVLEPRTRDEFLREVRTFTAQAKVRWWDYVAYDQAQHQPSHLWFTIVNDTEENFEDVVMEVRLPLPRRAIHQDADDALGTLEPPEPPTAWEQNSFAARLRETVVVEPAVNPLFSIRAESADLTLVTFSPQHVRPHSPKELPPLLVTLDPKFDGQTLTATWRATARNTKGAIDGEVTFRVGSARAETTGSEGEAGTGGEPAVA